MGRRREWVARVRANPKYAMEQDLGIAAGGVFIILMGGLLSVTGFHDRTQPIQNNAPNPALGNVIGIIGVVVIAAGMVLSLVNLVVWLTGRRRQRSE
jgi:uncharacterized membrane protein YidH (DUF202 family)